VGVAPGRRAQVTGPRTPGDGPRGSRIGAALPDVALLALTAAGLILCYLIARPFVSVLAWAMALAIVAWPLHRRIAMVLRPPWLAAACSTVAVVVLIVVPAAFLVPAVIDEAAGGYKLLRAQVESGAFDAALQRNEWVRPAWEWLRQRVDIGDVLQRSGALLGTAASFAVKSSFISTIELALVFFFLFFMLRDHAVMVEGVAARLPLSTEEAAHLARVARDTVYATVYGKVLVAAVQGLLGGLMLWWLGFSAAWFWAIVMAMLSIVPMLGPPLVWVPAAALLALDGAWGQAALLVGWGAAVVGLADNVLYPLVVGRYLHMHTVPMLVALIGGIVVFGAVGFFLGPLVLAVTLALLDIWRARRTENPARQTDSGGPGSH